jgi:hypothetical protein
MNSSEKRHLQVGDACRVLAGRHEGAVVQVDERALEKPLTNVQGAAWGHA